MAQKKIMGFTCRSGLLQYVKEVRPQEMVTINAFVVSPLYRFVPVQLEDGSTVLVKQDDLRHMPFKQDDLP